jgi:hypothetical protein
MGVGSLHAPERRMFKALMLATLLVFGVVACRKKAVGHTSTHTSVSTVTKSGEMQSSDTTTTPTQKADGTQTVRSTVTTEHTIPAPSDAPTP